MGSLKRRLWPLHGARTRSSVKMNGSSVASSSSDLYLDEMESYSRKFEMWVSGISAIHLCYVIPANVASAIIIMKGKELWTHNNIVMVINAIVCAIGSLLLLVPRYFTLMGHISGNLSREAHATFGAIYWWIFNIVFRISSNR